MSNPWNGKVVFEAFWWNCWNTAYTDWYTYLAALAPRLAAMGFDGIWTPPPFKGDANGGKDSISNMGYTPYDYYDLGSKLQQGCVQTRFGTLDSFLRLVAIAHANGLEVYPDIVIDHCDGGGFDNSSPADLTDRYKAFQYAGFAASGRWPKSWMDFHSNPVHWFLSGDWPFASFGPDICYQGRCSDSGAADQNCYMRREARDWFVWFTRQTGVDGFRFDDVKGFPPEVVEDLLYNAMGPGTEYFCVGEFVSYQTGDLDGWVAAVENRSGAFDYPLRGGLYSMVYSGGYFDMGSLPNYQQQNRYKTVPFVNNHDTWHGRYWDSAGDNSNDHDQRTGDWAKNGSELAGTIDPDNPRAQIAYAVAMTVDGNPQLFYEDLFVNYNADRTSANPATLATRPWLENLVWCHQKLEFKAGAYKVRFQGSQQLLILERSARAIVGVNNDGSAWHDAWVATDFGPNVELHDYSGSRPDNIWTNQDGWVSIAVPPTSYSVWGRVGIEGGFGPAGKPTTQEFQMDDDLGDSNPATPGYGGKLTPGEPRTAGSIWAGAGTEVEVWVYLDDQENPPTATLQVLLPDSVTGAKSSAPGPRVSGPVTPLNLKFTAATEGYYQLTAMLTDKAAQPVRAYVKATYTGPARSAKF
ncbi:alpha-amylase [Granulicella rosea]|uniref:Alpha-amylase n=1 Tax=Granulicella rosea TaxID=474952 RepID=A0A239E7G5_9BACT|nr:alpha-amylase domain-containing protein [Granulicella rosea]SNS39824.1 alpha-amylase [Granulicella rosea]